MSQTLPINDGDKVPFAGDPSEDDPSLVLLAAPGTVQLAGAQITINEQAGVLASGALMTIRERARLGDGPRPYVLNGDGDPCEALAILWFGDNPETGGLYAKTQVIDASAAEVANSDAYRLLDLMWLLAESSYPAAARFHRRPFARQRTARASGRVETAIASLSTPLTESEGTLPDNLMWMPAGPQDVTPSVGGQPTRLRFETRPKDAEMLNQQLQQMRAAAKAGEGDEPYIDFNHEDGERAGEALAFYWGGDDPKTGGIRLRVAWSAAGKEAVLGRNFRRFSPAWDFDRTTHEIKAVYANVGGLVNRAAFQNIAPVTASGSRAQAMGPRTVEFMEAAEKVRAQGKTLAEAVEQVVRANPNFYESYRRQIVIEGQPDPRLPGSPVFPFNKKTGNSIVPARAKASSDDFHESAVALAKQKNISVADAMTQLARANNGNYRQYRKHLYL